MEREPKRRKALDKRKARVSVRRSPAPTGETVEVWVVEEETRAALKIPNCLKNHKFKRLTS